MEIRSIQLYQITSENRVLDFMKVEDGYYIDSRKVAEGIGIDHHNFLASLYEYQNRLERWGQLRFETEVGYRPQGGGNPKKFVWLNRNQTLFAITLSRNTDEVVEWKMSLIEALDLLEKQQYRQLSGPKKHRGAKHKPAPTPEQIEARILQIIARLEQPTARTICNYLRHRYYPMSVVYAMLAALTIQGKVTMIKTAHTTRYRIAH